MALSWLCLEGWSKILLCGLLVLLSFFWGSNVVLIATDVYKILCVHFFMKVQRRLGSLMIFWFPFGVHI